MSSNLLKYILLAVLCYLEYRIVMIIQNPNLQNQLILVLSPLDGYAWWRAFQNRLLAGYLIELIGLQGLIMFSIALKNFLFYYLTKNINSVILFVLAFIILQDIRWLCAWDLLDIIFMTLFLIGLQRKYSLFYHMLIFGIALLNRESALFIPLYLIIDAFFNKKNILPGVAMMAAGIVVTMLLRNRFIRSIQNYIGEDLKNEAIGNHIYIKENITNFFNEYLAPDKVFSIIPLLMLLFIIYTFRIDRLMAFFLLSVFAITMIFGVIHESRVWLVLIPFLVYTYQKEYVS